MFQMLEQMCNIFVAHGLEKICYRMKWRMQSEAFPPELPVVGRPKFSHAANEKQECIPVGCVPPALYHTGISVQRGSLSGRPPPL